MYIIIPYLKKQDGISVGDQDKDDDGETIMTKEFVSNTINSMTSPPEAGMKRLRTMSTDGTADDHLASQSNDWERSSSMAHTNGMSEPEILLINPQRIKVIQNLNEFTNLRRLSLVDNIIEKIEGLEACKLLEELSLEK